VFKYFTKNPVFHGQFLLILFLKRIVFNYFIIRHLKKSNKTDSRYLLLNNKPKRILFASSIGGNATSLGLETFLGKSLSNQGIETRFILCDEFLPACFECTYINKPLIKDKFVSNQDSHFCKGCFSSGRKTLNSSNLKFSVFSDYVSKEERSSIETLSNSLSFEDLKTYSIHEVAVGMHALAGALRYLTKSELVFNPGNLSILKSFFIAAEISRVVYTRMMAEFKPDVVITLHGLYIPQGIIVDLCKAKKIPLKVWNVAYRKNTFLVSNNDTYHQSLLYEDTSEWKNLELTNLETDKILNYLESRSEGSEDWLSFVHHGVKTQLDPSVQEIVNEYDYKNIVCLLTNVGWDAQVHYKQNVFKDMDEWLFSTIDWFIKHPEYLLIIRVHPAEVTSLYPSIELTSTKIIDKYKRLPKNIVLIKSEDETSTYEICKISSKIIIYATKMGVELAPFEKPIIVAGEAWIKNKDLTHDPKSQEAYFELLENVDKLSLPLKFERNNAIKYAYHFFFKKMIDAYGIKTVINPSCLVLDPKVNDVNRLTTFVKNFIIS
jgi:hypothetical protein